MKAHQRATHKTVLGQRPKGCATAPFCQVDTNDQNLYPTEQQYGCRPSWFVVVSLGSAEFWGLLEHLALHQPCRQMGPDDPRSVQKYPQYCWEFHDQL